MIIPKVSRCSAGRVANWQDVQLVGVTKSHAVVSVCGETLHLLKKVNIYYVCSHLPDMFDEDL